MYVNTASSVNVALHQGLRWLLVGGNTETSRNGDVLVAPAPVLTVSTKPRNRVLISETRGANPFFHLMESLWMLAGRCDLGWLAHYNKRMLEYSDDGGITQPGAYGYRWRNFFGYDQINQVVDILKKDRKSRRAVLTMWDAGVGHTDVPGRETEIVIGDMAMGMAGSRDIPCNTHVYFDTHGDRLNMTVCCRSNDIWWGAHGANAVHFSFLLEYIAAKTQLPMGVMRQFSNNYHLYTGVVPKDTIGDVAREVMASDFYANERSSDIFVSIFNGDPHDFDTDLLTFMEGVEWHQDAYRTPFFKHLVLPMAVAWGFHKKKDYEGALHMAKSITADDWRTAAVAWLARARQNYEAKKGS